MFPNNITGNGLITGLALLGGGFLAWHILKNLAKRWIAYSAIGMIGMGIWGVWNHGSDQHRLQPQSQAITDTKPKTEKPLAHQLLFRTKEQIEDWLGPATAVKNHFEFKYGSKQIDIWMADNQRTYKVTMQNCMGWKPKELGEVIKAEVGNATAKPTGQTNQMATPGGTKVTIATDNKQITFQAAPLWKDAEGEREAAENNLNKSH